MCKRIYVNLFSIVVLLNNVGLIVCDYNVVLANNGPIVKGGTITFTATVLNEQNRIIKDPFRYEWTDNAIPSHERTIDTPNGTDVWSVYFNDKIYPQGPYNIQVIVCRVVFLGFCMNIGSNRMTFYVTETLNGQINLIQHNKTQTGLILSNAEVVNHTVEIQSTDLGYIKSATSVVTYWFIDCNYMGSTTNYQFLNNYTKADQDHTIETLVVADFAPLPPPITTTTTTTTTTTKPTTTTTTTKPTTTKTTTAKPTISTTITTTTKPKVITDRNAQSGTNGIVKVHSKRDVKQKNETLSRIKVMVNNKLVPYNGSFPYVCNGSKDTREFNKTFGYFTKHITIKAPVSKVNITGNNWLQHGDLLSLNIKCQASLPLKYCVDFRRGLHNVTGNETCTNNFVLETCEFPIQRYLTESTEYTIIIIIENEISKKVTPVTVTVYKVKKQAQLSVIVVPVAFSLVAVVLIVFGVAYYIQNRSRFVVEVADFNFGQNYSDMEYKTFKERLRDSISSAFFTKVPSPGSSETPVWPPGRQYGSMTN